MKLTFLCPSCQAPNRSRLADDQRTIACAACDYHRDVPEDQFSDDKAKSCVVCSNPDLWRQKDFPQSLGILMVALGAIFSSIAWYYHRPVIALSILAAFGVLDMILYIVMPDVLVCYRCRSRHGVTEADESFSGYDHELGERYRQERLRLEQEQSSVSTHET